MNVYIPLYSKKNPFSIHTFNLQLSGRPVVTEFPFFNFNGASVLPKLADGSSDLPQGIMSRTLLTDCKSCQNMKLTIR